MVISNRLDTMVELTQGYSTVLDIGSDHGLLLLKAFQKGYIQKGIASDLREKPLNQAKKNFKDYPVDYVRSDGFLDIKEPYDLVVIAGMGAHLITDILKHAPHFSVPMILQPNDKPEKLRDFLSQNGFKIIDEFVAFEKHYYPILLIEKGDESLDEVSILLGPKLKDKPEAKAYYEHKINTLTPILNRADENRKSEIRRLIMLYEEGLARFK